MKNKAVKMGALALIGGAFLATTGCGMTAEKVVDKMYESEIESFTGVSTVDFGVKVKVQGTKVEFTAEGEVDIDGEQTSKDEAIVHTLADLEVSMIGDIEAEIYSLVSEDEVEAYVYTSEDDTWYHSVQELEEAVVDEDLQKDIEKAVRKVLAKAELQKNTEKVDGEECYVLHLNTNLDAFKEVYELLYDKANEESDGELDDALEEADLTNDDIIDLLGYFNVDLTIYASKSDGYCCRVVMDLSDSDLDGLLEALMDITDMDEDDLPVESLELSACLFDITLSDINDTSVKVPKDVEEDAYDMDMDLGDIVY